MPHIDIVQDFVYIEDYKKCKLFMQMFTKQCRQGAVKGFKVRRGGWNQPI